MLNAIRATLNSFSAHGLNDLDKAKLMSRVDTKYVFNLEHLNTILEAVVDDYSVLDIDGRRISRYSSLYYDTDDLLFYTMHHQGHANRHKVRVRHYVDSAEKFVEVKFKNNKKKTIKKRTQIALDESVYSDNSQSFMASLNVPHYDELIPCQESSYYRIALASEERGERVTIDVGLRSRSLLNGENIIHEMPDVVIVEVKQSRISRWTPISRAIRDQGIRKLRYSKYCMGMVLTHLEDAQIKTNRFKKIVRKVSNISHAFVA